MLTRAQATKLLSYYPNDPAAGCPYGWGNVTWPSLGAMYKRYASMAGDLTMAAPRRLLAETMARQRQRVYSYRWDVAALNTSSTIGVGHFAEVCLCALCVRPVDDADETDPVCVCESGAGYYPAGRRSGAAGAGRDGGADVDVVCGAFRSESACWYAHLFSRDGVLDAVLTLLVSRIPTWPAYAARPANLVFRLPRNASYVEEDTDRAEGMAYINSLAR